MEKIREQIQNGQHFANLVVAQAEENFKKLNGHIEKETFKNEIEARLKKLFEK